MWPRNVCGGAEAGPGSTDLASESPVTCLGMEHVTYFKAEKKDKKGEGRGEEKEMEREG